MRPSTRDIGLHRCAGRLPLRCQKNFASSLKKNKKAAEAFSSLAPSHQRQYTDWIASAKREETRARRIAEALKLLTASEKLGMR
jgi:uncharacterized protein YdeI (YjbR/CyaY-like superfamily)